VNLIEPAAKSELASFGGRVGRSVRSLCSRARLPDAGRCRFARLPNPAADLAAKADLATAAEVAAAADLAVKIRVLADLAMAMAMVLRTIAVGESRSSYYVDAG
jgi:hypothetical protein